MNIEANSTDERIVEATYRILREEGSKKATTKKIASAAEVNEVTIFRKFENKRNLIKVTKEHFMNLFLEKIDEIFDFDEDEGIDEYIQKNFRGVLSLSEDEWSILKIGMEEFREDSDSENVLITITDRIFAKLKEFYTLQKEKGVIKDVNIDVLSTISYSVTFQTLMLWRVYGRTPEPEKDNYYGQEYLNILYHGIK